MDWSRMLWPAAALAGTVTVASLAVMALRRQPIRSTPAIRTAWLGAALSSGTFLFFIAASVRATIPTTTAIDVVALAITGVITGGFLALGLSRAPMGGAR